MHVPAHVVETDEAVLQSLIALLPRGTWAVAAAGSLSVEHVPFLLDCSCGGRGMLMGHVERANPVWRSLAAATDSVVVFQGESAYVAPSRYPRKRGCGLDYAVVHAHGMPRAVEDRDWLLDHVMRLADRQEAGAPADRIRRMLDDIVGIEIPIARLAGRWEVGRKLAAPGLQAWRGSSTSVPM